MKKRIFCMFLSFILMISVCQGTNVSYAKAAAKTNVTKTFQDKKMVKQLINNFAYWNGIVMTRKEKEKIGKLNEYSKICVAAFNSECKNGESEAIIKKTSLEKNFKDIFGKSINYSKIPTNTKNLKFIDKLVYKKADGSIAIVLGDWGTAYPTIGINKIYNLGNQKYSVECTCYLYDDETKSKTKIGTMSYQIKKQSNAKHKYVVTEAIIKTIK